MILIREVTYQELLIFLFLIRNYYVDKNYVHGCCIAVGESV